MKLLRLKITDSEGFRSLPCGFEHYFRTDWGLQDELAQPEGLPPSCAPASMAVVSPTYSKRWRRSSSSWRCSEYVVIFCPKSFSTIPTTIRKGYKSMKAIPMPMSWNT